MTARECELSRKFVNEVFNYFMLHDSRITGLSAEETRLAEEADLQLRMRRRQAELAKTAANFAAKDVDDAEDNRDPNGEDSLIPLSPGEFQAQQQWGNPLRVIRSLDNNYYTTPVLVVNRTTKEYRLRALRILRQGKSEQQGASEFKTLRDDLELRYPGWMFIM